MKESKKWLKPHGANLSQGYAQYEEGQADLTLEQAAMIQKIMDNQKKSGISRFADALCILFLVNGSWTPDVFGPSSGTQDNRFPNLLLAGADGDCHRLQMHTNQGASDVNTGFSSDGRNSDRIRKSVPRSHRKASAGMRLRHHIHNLISALFGNFLLHNKRTIQVLTALNR